MSDLKGTYEYNGSDVFTGDTISWVLNLRNESSTLTHTVLVELLEPAVLYGEVFTTSAFTYSGSAGANASRHDLTPGDSLSVSLSVVATDVDELAVTSIARISEAQSVLQLRAAPSASVTPDDEFFHISPDGPVLINHHHQDRMVTTDFPARVKAWQQGTGDDWSRAEMDDQILSGISFPSYLRALAISGITGETFTTAEKSSLASIPASLVDLQAEVDATETVANAAATSSALAAEISATGGEVTALDGRVAATETAATAAATTVYNLGGDVAANWARLNGIDTVQATQNTDIGTVAAVIGPGGATGSAIVAGDSSTIDAGSTNSVVIGGYTLQITNDSARSVIVGGRGGLISSSGDDNFIAGGGATGEANVISGTAYMSAVIAGRGGVISGTSTVSAIIGGRLNTLDGSYSAMVGGYLNSITDSASRSGIFVGNTCDISGTGDYKVIVGGTSNDITSTGSLQYIMGGSSTVISGSGALNGAFNTSNSTITLTSTYATLLGGRFNDITDGAYGAIVAGYGGTVSSTGSHNLIAGGSTGTISSGGNQVAIGGGGLTISGTGGFYSGLFAGNANSITGGSNESVIAGGVSCVISSSGRANFIGGSNSGTISGTTTQSAIIGGASSTVAYTRAIMLGTVNRAADSIDRTFMESIRCFALPTSAAGLSAGTFWNDSGTVKVA